MTQSDRRSFRGRFAVLVAVALVALVATGVAGGSARASEPSGTTLGAPHHRTTVVRAFTGTLTGTGAVQQFFPCYPIYCDTHDLHVKLPHDFWVTHDGNVVITLDWEDATADLDLFVRDAKGRVVATAYSSGAGPEVVELGELAPGEYTLQVRSYLSLPGTSYTGRITLTAESTLTEPAVKRHKKRHPR